MALCYITDMLYKGGLHAALFKPRTVKGTASQATPPGQHVWLYNMLRRPCYITM